MNERKIMNAACAAARDEVRKLLGIPKQVFRPSQAHDANHSRYAHLCPVNYGGPPDKPKDFETTEITRWGQVERFTFFRGEWRTDGQMRYYAQLAKGRVTKLESDLSYAHSQMGLFEQAGFKG